MKKRYLISWDNGNACGDFPETYTSRRAAERAAVAWKREMVAMEPTRAAQRDARAAYQWEVNVAPPEIGTPEAEAAAAEYEGTLEYFNRYIAGDR